MNKTAFSSAYIRRHRAQVKRNLAEAKERYQRGEIGRTQYKDILADGQRALAELNNTPIEERKP